MQNHFNGSVSPVSEAEQDECSPAEKAFIEWGINYEKQPGGSLFVAGDLDISNRGLMALPDLSSVSVGGDFCCDSNKLTSLEGAPATVGGDFYCDNNQLTSLEHAPATVGGNFYCNDNQLTSLEGAPTIFKKLKSDFGEFVSWSEMPENLRVSPETKARLEREKQEAAIRSATILQAPTKAGTPLRFKKPAMS